MISSGTLIACACIRARKWKLLAAGVAVAVAMISLAFRNPPIAVLALAAFLFAPGLTLFTRHPNSTPSRASLFCFAGYAFLMLLHPALPIAAIVSVITAAVLIYSSVADRKIKYAAISCGTAIVVSISLAHDHFMSETWQVTLLAPILVPAMFELWRRPRNVLIAE